MSLPLKRSFDETMKEFHDETTHCKRQRTTSESGTAFNISVEAITNAVNESFKSNNCKGYDNLEEKVFVLIAQYATGSYVRCRSFWCDGEEVDLEKISEGLCNNIGCNSFTCRWCRENIFDENQCIACEKFCCPVHLSERCRQCSMHICQNCPAIFDSESDAICDVCGSVYCWNCQDAVTGKCHQCGKVVCELCGIWQDCDCNIWRCCECANKAERSHHNECNSCRLTMYF